ncbi:MAG: DNA translocase FtsK 4TM domain-containing protein [Tannerellaceae bacterium]
MAKKTTKQQPVDKEPKVRFASLKKLFGNERTQFISGLAISILTVYIGLSILSFFFTGATDQSKIDNISGLELLRNQGQVSNWAGVWGAFISEYMINRWFGISSLAILFYMGSVGLKLMKVRHIHLLKRFCFSASLMIWGSLFFSFFFKSGYEDTYIYLGGQHGEAITMALNNTIGKPGTFLIILGMLAIIAVFSSEKTIPILRYILDLGWFPTSWIKFKRTKEKIMTPTFLTEANQEQELDPEEVHFSEVYEEELEELQEKKNNKKTSFPSISDVNNEFYTQSGEQLYTEEEDSIENVHPTPEPSAPKDESTFIEPKVKDLPKQKDNFVVTTVNVDEEFNANDTKEDKDLGFEVNVPSEELDLNATQLGTYDPRLDLSQYSFPTLDLLRRYESNEAHVDMEEQTANKNKIIQTLETYGIRIASIKATVGPTITLYEIVPEAGVRISKIRNLEDDIALSLSALGIRIIAPMPGKGTIGIEVPNRDSQVVSMHSVIASKKFQECKMDLPIAFGKTITNDVFMVDLCKMPHVLVAGATGQGKSVGLNAIITSLLYKKHPAELKFVMIDPKMVEFSIYSTIERHYLAKLPDADKAIITDFTKVVQTLNSLTKEMDDRYELLMKAHARNIKEYNEKFINRRLSPEKGHKYMPYIVVIIDEFGDLIMTAGKEIELPIARIAQKARAVGIHMIIATQRPSTNIITGTIKANFPARVAFRVSSMIDSRTILDSPGANQLIGRGDLLFSQGSDMIRVQCAFVDTPEVEAIGTYIGGQQGYPTAFLLPEYVGDNDGDKVPGSVDLSDRDALFDEAARLIVIQQQGSTSLIQRKFAIGYNRAGRLMDQLEAAGIVGPFEGSKARQVLIQDEYHLEQLINSLKS